MARKARSAKARPDASRAFREWFPAAQARSALPTIVEDDQDGGLVISIQTKHAILRGYLSEGELCVWGEHDEVSDILFWTWATPRELPKGGFICADCVEEPEVFPSEDALWSAHVFEPFLEWINTKLALATEMGTFGIKDRIIEILLLPVDAHRRSLPLMSVVPL